MVVVPYPRVNAITPESNAYRLDVSARSFGSDVTEGIGNLSKAIGGFGNMAAEHAIKFQEQENDLKVAEAENKFMLEDATVSANFRTTTGNNASPEALKTYYENLEEIRAANGTGLTPRQQQLYNQRTRNFQARQINAGATHVATQQRALTAATHAANREIKTNNTAQDPLNNQLFDFTLVGIEEDIDRQAKSQGWSPEMVANAKEEARTKAWAQRLTVMSRENPIEALDLFNKNRSQINSNVHPQLEARIQQGLDDRGSRTIANGIIKGDSNEILRMTPEHLKPRVRQILGVPDPNAPTEDEMGYPVTRQKQSQVAPNERVTQINQNAPLATAIEREAKVNGLDPDVLKTVASIESNGKINAVSPSGKHKGVFQLSDDVFGQYGKGDVFNLDDNVAAGAKSLAASALKFKEAIGRDPSATELYLAHQQGNSGVVQHVRNLTKPAWENMLATNEGKQKGEAWAKAAIWNNLPADDKKKFGSVENVTSGEFLETWKQRVEGGKPKTTQVGPFKVMTNNNWRLRKGAPEAGYVPYVDKNTPDLQITPLNPGAKGFNDMGANHKWKGIVFHHTAGETIDSALGVRDTSGNGYNFLIDKDGKIYQTAPITAATWHAGPLNTSHLGISFVAKDANHVSEAQHQAGLKLAQSLINSGTAGANVIGHGEAGQGKMANEGVKTAEAIRQWIKTVPDGQTSYKVAAVGPMNVQGSIPANTNPQAQNQQKLAQVTDEVSLERGMKTARELADVLAPNNPRFMDYTEQRMNQEFRQLKGVEAQNQLFNRNTVHGYVLGDGKTSVTSIDQIIGPDANPIVREAYYKLQPKDQQYIKNQIQTNQTQANKSTPEQFETFYRLRGLATSSPEEFMKVNPLAEDLSNPQKLQIQSMQSNFKKQETQRLQLTRMINDVKEPLRQAGLYNNKYQPVNKDRFDKFVGMYEVQIQQFQQQHKRLPDETETKQMVQRTLREISPAGWISGPTRAFEAVVPPKETAEISAEFQKRYNRAPTPGELRTIYLIQQGK